MRGWMLDSVWNVRRGWWAWVLALCVCGLVMEPRGGVSQEVVEPAAEAPMAKKRTEPRGRLPAYFGEVIDSQQREKVYEIQAKYLADIKRLNEQISALEKERDEAVRGVLTPEQAEKVRKLAEDARTKRGTGGKKRGGAEPASSESASSR